MHKQKLTDVPEHILAKPANIKKDSKWYSDYNIAAWFRFERLSLDMIKLHVYWQDDSGEHNQCVDQTTINSSSLLLSGIARLKVTGGLKSVAIVVETENQSFTVDELFVQPSRQSTNARQAL